jgi:crotonobetainyl-CoA:carnitine CoA-transferase CaiB-like acyl-CoA transferase
MGVLTGFRVLDVSLAMAGPFAAMRLGDLGADVIKVEPTGGEWQRRFSAGGAGGNRVNASFLSLNRNKRSLAVDLKQQAGRQIVLDLIRTADVLLQNYRPGVAARLGIDYDSVRAVNPNIVYVSLSGYGETGPYRERPGQDLLLQAMSGALYNVGIDSQPPAASGFFLADAVAAYTAFEGALAGLLHRERTGQGQRVDVNMLDAIIALQMQEMSIFSVGGKLQTRSAQPHGHTYIRAPYGIFSTTDGYLALAFPPLKRLGELLDLPEFTQMEDEVDGYVSRDKIVKLTRERLAERTTGEWLELLTANGIWASPVYTYAEVMKDPQVIHNKSLVTYSHPTEGTVTTPGFAIQFADTPAGIRIPAPVVGQHTRELLTELGYQQADIDAWLASGVIAEESV